MDTDYIIERLLEYEAEIYESLGDLKKQEAAGLTHNKQFQRKIKMINSLIMKENILLEKLINYSEIEDSIDLGDLHAEINTNLDVLDFDPKLKFNIAKRITSFFDSQYEKYDEEEDCAYFSRQSGRFLKLNDYEKEIKTNTYLDNKLLIKLSYVYDDLDDLEILNSIDNIKYETIFQNKTLGDKILNNYLDPVDLDKPKDENELQYLLFIKLRGYIIDLFSSFKTKDNEDGIKNFVSYVYLLGEANEENINNLYEFLEYSKLETKDNKPIYDTSDYLESFLISRNHDLVKKEVNVPSFLDISEETYNKLISLIKLEEKMYHTLIDNNFSLLEKLYEEEKEMLNNLNISYDELDKVQEIVFSDIELFIDDQKTKNIIQNRLMQIIPELLDSIIDPGQSKESYLTISYNHLVNSLNIFENRYAPLDDDHKHVYLDKIFESKYGLDDYILTHGKELMNIPEDYTKYLISHGKDNFIYEIDKDNQLFDQGGDIITLLPNTDLRESDSYDRANYDYQECELSDILDNISYENIAYLEAMAEDSKTDEVEVKLSHDMKSKKNKIKILLTPKHTK